MSRQYSPKTFLRQVPNHLLKELFARWGLLGNISWELQGETKVGLIYDAWQALPDAERAEIDRVFQAVHAMACEAGVRALVEEGLFHNVSLAAVLDRYEGFYHKAMWAYLRHERIFTVASLFNSADSLPACSWVRHRGMPRKTPAVSERATRALADALSEYYRENQGRGHRCTVETYLRGGRQHYFFAYPDDYVDTYIGHDDKGEFVKRPQKKAFEIVFVYDAGEGTLELYARGDRGVKARLLYIFCREILGENPPPEQAGDHPYELNGLLSPEFAFPTDPEDGVEEVCVLKMRLSLGNSRRRIILEADPQGGPQDLYDMMAEYLTDTCLAHAGVNVTHAEFRFRFAERGGERPGPLTFGITFPNKSNLKSLTEERRFLAEKYLKQWGIDRE